MMTGDERLAYMADQIFRNLAAGGLAAATAATADHIAAFWDPRMKAQAFALLDRDAAAFSAGAGEALRLLRDRAARAA
jgi:formate dehydrogenase subunit delta